MAESHWLLEVLTPINIVTLLIAALLAAWNTILRMSQSRLSGRIDAIKQEHEDFVEKHEDFVREQQRKMDELGWQDKRIERKMNQWIIDMEGRISAQERSIEHMVPIVERRMRSRNSPPDEPDTVRP